MITDSRLSADQASIIPRGIGSPPSATTRSSGSHSDDGGVVDDDEAGDGAEDDGGRVTVLKSDGEVRRCVAWVAERQAPREEKMRLLGASATTPPEHQVEKKSPSEGSKVSDEATKQTLLSSTRWTWLLARQ